MSRTNAQIISTIFNPVIDPAITFLLLIWADQQLNFSEKIEFSGIADLFTTGLMILCLFIFIRFGLISSPDIPDRQQRFLPLVVAAIVLFVGFLALSFAHAPRLIQALMACYAIETLIVAIISCWWKISIHTATMGCSLVVLTVQFGAIVLPCYLLLPLVGQARIVLERHTIAQTIAGAFLGIVLTTIQLLPFK
jgi:membrane-associated phospholipid phosphatase